MTSGWVDALTDTTRLGHLTHAQHQVLANWHDPEIRRAWATRADAPQEILAARIRIEADPVVLSALLGHLEEVDETTLDIAVRRGREAALALVLSPKCPDRLSVRIIRHLRHSDRGWLEHQLGQHTLEVLADRTKTLALLYSTLDLDVFYRLMHHATSSELQDVALRRLSSLAPTAESTGATYAKAAKLPWEPAQQARYEQLLARQAEETHKLVSKVRGLDTSREEERRKALERAQKRQDLLARSQTQIEDVVAELEAMYLQSPADAKLAAEISVELLGQDTTPTRVAIRFLPLVGLVQVEGWVGRTLAANTSSSAELTEIATTLDGLRNQGYNNNIGRLLEQIGKRDWSALQAALQQPGHHTSARLRQAAFDTASSSSELRWLLEHGHTHERTAVSHAHCDLGLLLDLKANIALSSRNTAAKVLAHALTELPAERLETLDRLIPEWTGTTRALLETARTV